MDWEVLSLQKILGSANRKSKKIKNLQIKEEKSAKCAEFVESLQI